MRVIKAKDVVDAIRPLLQMNDVDVIETYEDPDFFGNVVVVLSSPEFKLRIVTDRGECRAQISTRENPDWFSWIDIDAVLLAIGIHAGFKKMPVERDLRELVRLLLRNFKALREAFQEPRRESTLESIAGACPEIEAEWRSRRGYPPFDDSEQK